ncbi:MAG: internal scaffolding protein [Microviridae sp.]|nr:MAG: internal scaffolding protein [Microviridae sp.]
MSSNPKHKKPISTTQPLILSNYSPKKRYQITFNKDSKYTKQSFKEECDINTIMARYQSTGQIPVINQTAPQYLDVSAGADFQSSMEFVAGAQTLFQEMPSSIRNRFGNDPREFLDFCSQEKNRPELAEMGLLKEQMPQLIPTPQQTKQIQPEAAKQAADFSLEKSPA